MPPKRAPTNRVTKSAKSSTKRSTSALKTKSKESITPISSKPAIAAQATMPVNTISHPSTSASASASASSAPPKGGPVYFWKPNEGNGYLGQWYWSKFVVDGEQYATAEMWMMVGKARLFGDEAVAKNMLATTDPKRHKALGREVSGFNQRIWDDQKMRIVIEGNIHKFTVSEDAENLRTMLLATGDRELVEASPMDRIWGIGFGERNAAANRHRWGKNLLGKALMDVRQKLRQQEAEGKKE